MGFIKRVRKNGEIIEILIECPECGKSIFISEDDCFCLVCGEEIETANIQSWAEYYKLFN